MITDTDKARVAELLTKLQIPAEQIQVFGRARLNVHVVCRGRDAADKWAQVLSTIEPGRKISCVRHDIERKAFKQDAANQTHMRGWLVAL